jgi:sterol desaturase/sphingolipid hydroxylase (fatty acid hydroxylase superfamily)
VSSPLIASLWEHYQLKLSLITLVTVFAGPLVWRYLFNLVPAFAKSDRLNREDYRRKMAKPAYAANQRMNRKWGLFFTAVIFLGIIPFTLTPAMPVWWKLVLDCVVILMVYDFFYYLTHRFVFHQAGSFMGPLIWMHAVHHRQHNPCRGDSSYIHPLEVFIGLGLYVAVIFALSFVLGRYSVPTIVVTWIAFQHINLHNHDLWEDDRFPFRYWSHVAKMHHNHHARFTGGNYATITLLYDWMFGTLDYGDAPRKAAPIRQAAPVK